MSRVFSDMDKQIFDKLAPELSGTQHHQQDTIILSS
jgi:hypothetical protein